MASVTSKLKNRKRHGKDTISHELFMKWIGEIEDPAEAGNALHKAVLDGQLLPLVGCDRALYRIGDV